MTKGVVVFGGCLAGFGIFLIIESLLTLLEAPEMSEPGFQYIVGYELLFTGILFIILGGIPIFSELKNIRIVESIRSIVPLGPKEVIHGIYKMVQKYLTWDSFLEGYNGYLVLITNRLLFYKEAEGRKAYELTVDLNLYDIEEITVGGGLGHRFIVINRMIFFPKYEKPKTLERLIRSHHSRSKDARNRNKIKKD